jgi:hypothetical protein
MTPRQQSTLLQRLDEWWVEIVRIVHARLQGAAACVRLPVLRQLIIDMTESIERTTLITSRSRLRAITNQRKQLKSLVSDISKMIRKIGKLSPSLRRQIEAPNVLLGRGRIEWLTAFRAAVDPYRLLPPAAGGGNPAKLLFASQKDQASHGAYFILKRVISEPEPDLELTGLYITLSEILIYIALGHPNPQAGESSPMYHPCRIVLNWYEEHGYPEPTRFTITRQQPQ